MPIPIKSLPEHEFSEIPFIAIAIRRPNPYVHTGLLYRDDAAEIRLSHLAWHCRFYGSDIPSEVDLWIEPHFNDIVQEQLAAFLIHRAEEQARGDIPYSIIRQGKCFDETGKFISGEIGEGLTCATYILGAFEALEIPIVQLNTWRTGREEDLVWFEAILQLLVRAQPPASQQHIEVQRAALPNVVRYRPEEVAAAFSLFRDVSLRFEEVEPPSLEILQFLRDPAAPAAQ